MSTLFGTRWLHLCIDMQEMFAQPTPWQAPWLDKVLPAVEALVERAPAQTVFTRFIPPQTPEQATGNWRHYYEHWPMMTQSQLPPGLVDLVPSLRRFVPPARVVDKPVYSPWLFTPLHQQLQTEGIETIVMSGGETDVCVLAAVLGAIDLGYRVVVAGDAVFSSADPTHDAMLGIYGSRFGQQLTLCKTEDLIRELDGLP